MCLCIIFEYHQKFVLSIKSFTGDTVSNLLTWSIRSKVFQLYYVGKNNEIKEIACFKYLIIFLVLFTCFLGSKLVKIIFIILFFKEWNCISLFQFTCIVLVYLIFYCYELRVDQYRQLKTCKLTCLTLHSSLAEVLVWSIHSTIYLLAFVVSLQLRTSICSFLEYVYSCGRMLNSNGDVFYYLRLSRQANFLSIPL